ncbi:hypothetical protein GCM10010972_30670 [Cellulomonas carbonis]|nr:hypothetical protein GCM10010972_30670 [Cellulomonas carbonis]
MVLDAQRGERPGELALAVLGEGGDGTLEVPQRGRDHLALLAARARHDRDGASRTGPCREQRTRAERLVVGVRVHREEASGGHRTLGSDTVGTADTVTVATDDGASRHPAPACR